MQGECFQTREENGSAEIVLLASQTMTAATSFNAVCRPVSYYYIAVFLQANTLRPKATGGSALGSDRHRTPNILLVLLTHPATLSSPTRNASFYEAVNSADRALPSVSRLPKTWRPLINISIESTHRRKHVSSGGLPILSSWKVRDAALSRANELIDGMLSNRPDIRKALIESGVRFVVIGADEQVTDIPEYSDMEPKEFWDERPRGFGGRIVSCGEEDLPIMSPIATPARVC
jgi:hypothetical protein